MAVLLEVAVTTRGWPASSAGPALMPPRLIVCWGASSLTVRALSGSSVGASFWALIWTAKLLVTVLLAGPPSLTVTVIVTSPLALGAGVKVKSAVPPGVKGTGGTKGLGKGPLGGVNDVIFGRIENLVASLVLAVM